MSGVTEPASRPYTVDDLHAMPDLTAKSLPVAPVLAAEVASPSTQGDQEITVTRPFPVTVCPTRLLDGLRPGG